jgi:hypothetical protein
VSAPETLEQIAERIARETLSHRSTIWIRAEILAALREAEARAADRQEAEDEMTWDTERRQWEAKVRAAEQRAEKAEANDVLRSLLMRSHHKLLLHDSPASDALAREILEALATPAEEPKEEW